MKLSERDLYCILDALRITSAGLLEVAAEENASVSDVVRASMATLGLHARGLIERVEAELAPPTVAKPRRKRKASDAAS